MNAWQKQATTWADTAPPATCKRETEDDNVLPHHPQTDPSELKDIKRSSRRPPVLPHHRLRAARGWNLPIPEILCIIIGFILQLIASDPTSTLSWLALNAETAGWSGLIAGIPLLFVPLRVFWLDLAYIVIGLAIYLFMMSFIDGSYIFLGLVMFLGTGMMLSGVSHLVRRGLAYRLARRRAQK